MGQNMSCSNTSQLPPAGFRTTLYRASSNENNEEDVVIYNSYESAKKRIEVLGLEANARKREQIKKQKQVNTNNNANNNTTKEEQPGASDSQTNNNSSSNNSNNNNNNNSNDITPPGGAESEGSSLDSGKVSISTIHCPFVKPEALQTLNLLIEYRTPKLLKKVSRPPFNLAIVLDRSGSMEGDRLEFAKKAIQRIIDSVEPLDTLHLIQYDTGVQTVFEYGHSSNKSDMEIAVSQIQSGSSTNLMAGLMRGYDLLQRSPDQIYSKRIFLFSDGYVNAGITNTDHIKKLVSDMVEYGVNVTSFGVGAEFDVNVMQGIAESGHGSYILIDNVDEIPSKVNLALDLLSSLVALNLNVEVKALGAADSSNNFVSSKILKVHTNAKVHENNGAFLGDMASNDIRTTLLSLEIDTRKVKDVKASFPILNIRVKYDVPALSSSNSNSKSSSGSVELNERAYVSLLPADSSNSLELLKEPVALTVAMAINQAGDDDEIVMKALHDGDIEKAKNQKSQAIQRLKEVQKDDTTGMVFRLLQKNEETLQVMERDSGAIEKISKRIGYEQMQCKSLHSAGLI